jgi:hypothetical protein
MEGLHTTKNTASEDFRLDCKVIASTNTLAYLASSTVMKEKKFHNIATRLIGTKFRVSGVSVLIKKKMLFNSL